MYSCKNNSHATIITIKAYNLWSCDYLLNISRVDFIFRAGLDLQKN